MPTFPNPWSRLSATARLGWGCGALLSAQLLIGAAGLLALDGARTEAAAVEARWQTRLVTAQALQLSAAQVASQAQALSQALILMPGQAQGVVPDPAADGAPDSSPLAAAQAMGQAVRLLAEQRGHTLELEARLHATDWPPAAREAVDAAVAAGAVARPVIDALVRAATDPQAREAQGVALRQLAAVDAPWRQQLRRLAEVTQTQRELALHAATARQARAQVLLAGLIAVCLLGSTMLSWALLRGVRRSVADSALQAAVQSAQRAAAAPEGEPSAAASPADRDEIARLQAAMASLQRRLRLRERGPSGDDAAAGVEARSATATAHGGHTPVDLTAPVPTAASAARSGAAAAATPAPASADAGASWLSSDAADVTGAAGAAPLAPAADFADRVVGAPPSSAWLDTVAGPEPTPMRSMPVSAEVLVHDAVRVAERGSEVVTQVVSNMEDISASSRKINEILATIDSIAFQTNILALNAAVQAARAGQTGPEGRGFGAVAGEVRGLAQRAASAAREIKGLIHASVEKAESGTRLVRDAGTTMDAIVSSVQSVTELVGQISHQAGEQQAETLAAADRSVQRLDHLTRQNAALVEHSASAADALRQQADRLEKVVGAFKLLQQTQEAAWTAHTAIHSARASSRGDTQAGGLDPLGPPAPPKRPPAEGEAGAGWEGF